MKKYLAVLACMALACSIALAGCSGGTQSSSTAAEDSSSAEVGTVGGWTVNSEATNQGLVDDQKEVFDKAIAELDGVDYEPIAVVAQQLVAGMNYAYLCQGTTVTAEPVTSWYIVTVYKDLDDKASITAINEIALDDVKVTDDTPGAGAAGAWEVPDSIAGAKLPAEADEAFTAAMEQYTGVSANPVVLLGSQVVAGANYKVLCIGAPVTQNPVNSLYVATVYQDPENKCEISDMQVLDLAYYVTDQEAGD